MSRGKEIFCFAAQTPPKRSSPARLWREPYSNRIEKARSKLVWGQVLKNYLIT